MSEKLIHLDNSFSNFEITKLNPVMEEVINSNFVQINPEFVDPYKIIEEISNKDKIFENNFPNNRYMKVYLEKLIKYFENLEEYKECAIIKNYLAEYFNQIPCTKEEVLEEQIKLTKQIADTFYKSPTKRASKNPEVIALNMYESVGRLFLYSLGLWNEELPLTQSFLERGIVYPQLMAMEMLKELSEEIVKID
jgi:hypothetical protein